MSKTWILLANSRHARLFERDSRSREFIELADFINPDDVTMRQMVAGERHGSAVLSRLTALEDAITLLHGDQALAYGFAGVIPFVVLTVIAHLAASVSIARDKRLAVALG